MSVGCMPTRINVWLVSCCTCTGCKMPHPPCLMSQLLRLQVRSLVQVLPFIDKVEADPFNSHPTDTSMMGPDALQRFMADEKLPAIQVRTPLVELPLGATEDRICGAPPHLSISVSQCPVRAQGIALPFRCLLCDEWQAVGATCTRCEVLGCPDTCGGFSVTITRCRHHRY
jgi:hypothetical protein